jgi:RimJ/RimL family protein N-acetyltransferase
MSSESELTDLRDYPKEFQLTDGSSVWLRPIVAGDVDRVFAFFQDLPEKDRRYFKHDVSRRETIAGWCETIDYDRNLPILAVARSGGSELVVANGTLHTERHGWSVHVGRIRVQVGKAWRNRGLGQLMLRELCDRASIRGIEKLQALVRSDNEDGLRVIRKLGFRKEGTFKQHALDKRGGRHDVVILYQDLEDLWRRMADLNLDLDTPFLP